MLFATGIGATDVGKRRESNEDALLVDNELGLFAVADGMGGHAGGEVASAVAIQTFTEQLGERRALLSRVASGEEETQPLVKLVKDAVLSANRAVFERASAEPAHAGMGCTLVALCVAGGRAVLGHVGDSRLYLLRGGTLTRLTFDHTFIGDAVRAGIEHIDMVARSRYAHVLTRAVGTTPAVEVDTLALDLAAGDRFLLCSDGLTEYLDGDALRDALGGELEAIPDELVARANVGGGRDNITAVVVDIVADDARVARAIEPGQQLAVLAQLGLLSGLSGAQLFRVAQYFDIVDVPAGEALLRGGQPLAGLYVVAAGRLALSGGRGSAGELRRGDSFGEAALFASRAAGADVVATVPTKLLVLSREGRHRLAHRWPWLGVELLERVGERLTRALDGRFVDPLDRAAAREQS